MESEGLLPNSTRYLEVKFTKKTGKSQNKVDNKQHSTDAK
jgi:hypothetical protein